MQKYSFFWIPIILCFFLYSCSKPTDDLRTAERIMESAPDSALRLLQGINVQQLHTSNNKSLYSLLLCQALAKNHVEVASDSLLSIVTDCYDKKNPERAGYTWFYCARIANNQGNADVAARYLINAQGFAEITQNDKLRGIVYSDKGTMYQSQGQTDSSIYYFKLASKSFLKIKNYNNVIIELLNIGNEYLKISKFDSARSAFLIAEKTLKKHPDNLLSSNLCNSFGFSFSKQNKYDSALIYYKKAPFTNISVYESNKYLLIANAYLQTGKLDLARIHLQKIKKLQEMEPDYYELWQNLYEKEGNFTKALTCAKRAKEATDSLNKRKLDISFAGLEKKYNFQNLQISNKNLTIKNKQNGILLLFSLLIISTLVIVVLFTNIQSNKRQLQTQKQLVAQEKALLEKEKEKVERERENSELLKKQLKMHEILLKNIEEYRKNSVKRLNYGDSDSKITHDPAFFQELITSMDVQYHDISSRLKQHFTQLTEQDILICCLLLANFDTGNIAIILNVDNSSIIKRRYRLRLKLGLQKSDNLINFLRSF